MSKPAAPGSHVQQEAAAWFARLSRLSVSTDDLRRFRDWKQDPEHAEAYGRVERAWESSGQLGVDPEIAAATKAALERYAHHAPASAMTRFAPRAPMVAFAALAALFGLSTLVAFQSGPSYATRIGERSLVTLEDGSHVQLNTDSQLSVRFTGRERRAELVRGEAFFEVAHDAARPFIVAADGARVRAVGTKFDVRRLADGVQVTLLEGRVRLGTVREPEAATLAPNQQLTVSGGAVGPPRPTDAAAVSGWTSGRLTFHATPLADAVAEVNRYAAHKVALDAPPGVARQAVTGVFDAGDTQAFVSTVAAALDLQAMRSPDGSISLRPRGQAGG